MHEEANTPPLHTRRIDLSNQFRHDLMSKDKINHESLLPDSLVEKGKLKVLSKIWNALSRAAFNQFGIEVPKLNSEMVQWAFVGSGFSADIEVFSGLIRLDGAKMNDFEDIVTTLAHEFAHFIARRLALKRDQIMLRARSGLRFTGPVYERKTLDFSETIESDLTNSKKRQKFIAPESHTIGMSMLDEAVTEILSIKLLNAVKSEIFGPEFEGEFVPSSYPESRRFYQALVRNLVFAWNNPELRFQHFSAIRGTPTYDAITKDTWVSRTEKLALDLFLAIHRTPEEQALLAELSPAELATQANRAMATISEDQIFELFEDTIVGKAPVYLVAKLINTMLGERMFQFLQKISWSAFDQDILSKRDNSYEKNRAWKFISQPEKSLAFKTQDTDVWFDNKTLTISGDDVPNHIPTRSYEDSDGTQLGLADIFRAYENRLRHPIGDIHDLGVAAQLVTLGYSNNARLYPFDFGALHRAVPDSLFVTEAQRSVNFCFKKLCSLLEVDPLDHASAIISENHDVLGYKFQVHHFNLPSHPDLFLSKVKTNSTDYYFFSKKPS